MNHGQPIEEQLKQLLAGQNKIADGIPALKTEQDNKQTLITDLSVRFAELEQRTARIDTLEQTIVYLEAYITDLECRSIRRSNLVVFGIQDDPAEYKMI